MLCDGTLYYLMGTGGGFSAGLDLTEEPDQDNAGKAGEGDVAEDINKCPEQRLMAELLIELGLAGGSGVAGIRLMAEISGQIIDALLEPVIRTGNSIGEVMLMKVGATGNHGLRY